MKTSVIACKTIETEVREAMRRAGAEYPVHWLESGLHNVPVQLNAAVQSCIDDIGEGRVLLAMGFCGNSVKGIASHGMELVIPRSDDCISILLGSVERRIAIGREYAAYFLTDGWLRGERNVIAEYRNLAEKYDEETAESIMESLYGHYRTLALLDTGLAPMQQVMEAAAPAEQVMGLKRKVLPATLDWLVQLFTGPWEEQRFLIKAPGTVIEESELLALSGGGLQR